MAAQSASTVRAASARSGVLGLLKAGLRKAAVRTRDALWTAIGRLLDGFSPDERRNHLTNSGYEFE